MKWWSFPGRADVILHPRDWRVRFYSRGVMRMITGMFQPDGTVCCNKIRLGRIMPRAA